LHSVFEHFKDSGVKSITSKNSRQISTLANKTAIDF